MQLRDSTEARRYFDFFILSPSWMCLFKMLQKPAPWEDLSNCWVSVNKHHENKTNAFQNFLTLTC